MASDRGCCLISFFHQKQIVIRKRLIENYQKSNKEETKYHFCSKETELSQKLIQAGHFFIRISVEFQAGGKNIHILPWQKRGHDFEKG